jgi:hypothetical protein
MLRPRCSRQLVRELIAHFERAVNANLGGQVQEARHSLVVIGANGGHSRLDLVCDELEPKLLNVMDDGEGELVVLLRDWLLGREQAIECRPEERGRGSTSSGPS